MMNKWVERVFETSDFNCGGEKRRRAMTEGNKGKRCYLRTMNGCRRGCRDDHARNVLNVHGGMAVSPSHTDHQSTVRSPNLDEPDLLVTPLSDANEDECFDPRGDIDEIVVSTDIEDDYHDSEGDIIYLENLLNNDTILNLPPKMFLDHDLRSLKDELDNNDLKSMVKVFDPDISAYSFYSLEPVAYEKICSSTCFVLNITMIWGEIAPDYEDSRARGFVHRSLDLQSLACLYMGIRYPRSY
ncbi:hypothetical protein Tco_1312975 [Tanacetum coccineum]